MRMKNTNRYFKTSNFNLATFLFAKGFELANIDRLTNQKRASFVFVDKPEIEELVHEFNFAQENKEVVMVDARKLIYATKTLKEKLYQNNF
jgi:hypothetical protein